MVVCRRERELDGMRPGDKAEVWKIWAGGPSPSADWFGGYEFVAETPRGVLVRQTSGVFEGVESLYPAREVRLAQKKDNPEDLLPTWEVRSHEGLEGTWGGNPVSGAGWLWLGAAVALGAVAWLATRKQESKSWTCRAGYRCTRSADAGMYPWKAENLITKEVSLHSEDPENMKDLTLVETAPDGSWAEYALEKPAVMNGADVYGSLL